MYGLIEKKQRPSSGTDSRKGKLFNCKNIDNELKIITLLMFSTNIPPVKKRNQAGSFFLSNE